MGRSSDSDNDRKKRKKKKRKRSKSRSASPDSRHFHKHKKSKKTKSKHRSESRSRESSRRRSRSYSKGRSDTSETSRSYDRRRSRSKSYDRRRSRSRSYDRRRSRSRERYSRRLSRSNSRSRRQSVSSDRRSGSRSRDRYSSKSSRRSHDKSCERYQRSRSASKTDKSDVKEDSCASIPGFSEMTPAEQTRIRMQMALKAAVAADEKLRGQAEGQKVGSLRSFEESLKFTQTVQDIEGAGFSPQVFKSSRSDKKIEKVESKEEFTFGTAGELRLDMIQRKPVDIDVNTEELANPDFFGDPEEKIQRWIQKLGAMRRKKLEGEVLT